MQENRFCSFRLEPGLAPLLVIIIIVACLSLVHQDLRAAINDFQAFVLSSSCPSDGETEAENAEVTFPKLHRKSVSRARTQTLNS